jgi:hypothetical protein
MEVYDSKFVDVREQAMAYIMHPDPGWANINDCGDFPCTAPLNAIIDFSGSTFEGTKPTWQAKDFQIIANNSGFAPYIEGCKPYSGMNAYLCKAEKLGVLLFESMDEDR